MPALEDAFGRRFAYLRLSLTEACNFRCVYCLPNGYRAQEGQPEPLTLSEITNLATAFSELGMWKIRLTGGEPTLRRDLTPIVATLSRIPGIRKVALSTNGYRLRELLPELKEAGLSAVNVSVDSLDPGRFERITGSGRLGDILAGIELALTLGLEAVKLNAVLLKDWNDEELEPFLEFVRHRKVGVRFIELMPTGQTTELFRSRHVRSDYLERRLVEAGWRQRPRGPADGPALEWSHSDYQGTVGVIAPYSTDFCATCNRLRVTSQGALRLCLFADGNHDLRPLLQHAEQKQELMERVRATLGRKDISHYLPEGRYGDNRSFSTIGG